MSKERKTRSEISSAGTTKLNQGPTMLNQGAAKQQANQQRPTRQSQVQTVLSVDLRQSARQAGEIHGTILPEIRRLRNLSTADLIQHANNNLKRLHELEAVTTEELGQLQGIFEAAASKVAEQIKQLHDAITSAERNPSLAAVAIADIAVAGVRNTGQKDFSWSNFLKDLGGAVTGAMGGTSFGPAGIVVGAVAGSVAASL